MDKSQSDLKQALGNSSQSFFNVSRHGSLLTKKPLSLKKVLATNSKKVRKTELDTENMESKRDQ